MLSVAIPTVLFTKSDLVRLAFDGMGAHTIRYQLVDHVRDPDDLGRSVVEFAPAIVVFHTAVDLQNVMRWSARLRTIRSIDSACQTNFVLLTDSQSDEAYVGAFQMGADAYIAIDQKIEVVRSTIIQLLSGEPFWNEKDVEAARARCGSCEVKLKLMDLEQIDRQILKLVTDGLSDKEIAARVFLAHQTVRNHVSALLATFKVRNRTELAVMCHSACRGNNVSAA
jgi:DNA-binding NarL/FixJ family response regulator